MICNSVIAEKQILVKEEAHLAKSGRHQILNKDVFGENKLQINNIYIAKMNFCTIL